jgi:hypothetical protein
MKKIHLKYPFAYKLNPLKVKKGRASLVLWLKNQSKEVLKNLQIRLVSLDPYNILVKENVKTLPQLKVSQEKKLTFKISAKSSARVYVLVAGKKANEFFEWESSWLKIKVGKLPELKGLFVLDQPYIKAGKTARFEAVIGNLKKDTSLNLEMWVEFPNGDFKEIDCCQVRKTSQKKEDRYTTKLELKKPGLYTVHAYLFKDEEKIGHETESVWVEEQ